MKDSIWVGLLIVSEVQSIYTTVGYMVDYRQTLEQ